MHLYSSLLHNIGFKFPFPFFFLSLMTSNMEFGILYYLRLGMNMELIQLLLIKMIAWVHQRIISNFNLLNSLIGLIFIQHLMGIGLVKMNLILHLNS